jgi:hypothetical protein
MSRQSLALLLLAIAFGLGACQSPEEPEATKKADVAAVVLTAPKTGSDKEWKPYLQQVISQHMEGVTDRVYPYYLPANNMVVEGDGRTPFDRQSENVTAVISRSVLPGNMLAFGSPDSAKMADLILSAFSGAKPDALKGSQVLFIGKPEDNARVKAPIEASGAKYIFVEAK